MTTKNAWIALMLACCIAASPVSAGESIKIGAPAPTFRLLDENNREVDIGTFIDRPTIIYFTHNACFYCTQIILYLKDAEKKYGSKLRIIGINIMAKDQKLIRSYKSALGFAWPMFAGNRADVLNAYRINYVPLVVFVDSHKIVREVVGHYIHEKELDESIQSLMEIK